ncbi:LysR family transcriptional regulator [Nakamurella endophytica]|nr:LysR family transcriptional regulator [Nakamurella endophytica]
MNGDPDPRHLRALLALAGEGTFTDAAIALGISQSAVSRALAQLEDLLGTRLVERTTRSLGLTAAGERAVPAASAALRALAAVREAVSGAPRPLRLGYSWGALGRRTTTVLQIWRRRHPGVPLEVHRVDARDAGLRSGVVDVAVIRGDGDDLHDPAVVSELLFEEQRVLALPVGHRLLDEPAPGLDALVGETVAVTPPIGTTTRALWPDDAGPARLVRSANTDEWLTAIASGDAVGVTTEATAFQHPHPDVVFVPAAGAPRVPVLLVWPAVAPHPAVAQLRVLLTDVLRDGGPS